MGIVFLQSKIFNSREVRREISNMLSKRRKKFREKTKRRMIDGPHTGRLYARESGRGFRRSHRASAKRQRPSPDTMTLVNAISDKSTGELSGKVFVAEKRNPRNGQIASKYAEILQTQLERPIMTKNDAAIEQKEIIREASQIIDRLGR